MHVCGHVPTSVATLSMLAVCRMLSICRRAIAQARCEDAKAYNAMHQLVSDPGVLALSLPFVLLEYPRRARLPDRAPSHAYSQSIAPTPAWRSAVLARGFARPCTQRNSIYYGNTADTRVFERHRLLSSVIGRAAMWPRCSRVVRIKRAQRKSQCGMNLVRQLPRPACRTQTISAHAVTSHTTFRWHDSVAVACV